VAEAWREISETRKVQERTAERAICEEPNIELALSSKAGPNSDIW
jgi:hypothetical protein